MSRAPKAHPAPGDPYLLGTDPEEARRLHTQHRLWADAAHDLWDRAGFGPGARLLDLGCGPGFAALELAERVGAGGRVLAVDESDRFIAGLVREANRRGLGQLAARVERVEDLRLEPASLDGAFVRWLFCFLPDPAPVIDRVVSGLRPGGRLVVWDYLNYGATTLQPRSPAFDRVLRAVEESFSRSGGDLNIGGRLPGLIAESGCRVLDLVPLARFVRPGTAFWDWPTQFFFSHVPRLVAAGLLTESERRAFEDEWRVREREPGTFLAAPPMIGIVAEKE
ncbi:MAG: methyltransferase domain-containing protein [Acidobacteria bacterium]|nr:methyltransferase domain-containing protein [Acidobacteriota bacterium]